MVHTALGDGHSSKSEMAYFSLLNLYREPFSNSPDPGLFFRSAQHSDCLQKLELAIRLRRGLNIVRGEIGAGKTTVCRHLIQSVSVEPQMDVHLLLDPAFTDELELLQALLQQMVGAPLAHADEMLTGTACKERIKQHLFQRAVEEDRIIVLVVDEAQKLTSVAVEVLRELLNYETNDYKLLQIILFGQVELDAVLKRHANFLDRANLIYTLEPMDATDVAAYIRFRLEQSERPERDRPRVVFTARAIRRVATLTGGYPRKINHLCHNLLILLVVRGQHRVTSRMVDDAAGRYRRDRLRWRPEVRAYAGGLAVVVGVSAATAAVVTALMVASVNRTHPNVVAVQTLVEEEVPKAEWAVPRASVNTGLEDPESRTEGVTEPTLRLGTSLTQADELTPNGLDRFQRVEEETPSASLAVVDDWLWPMGETARLGTVILQATDSVSEMASRVYGRSSHRLMQGIVRANPQIRNLNRIQLGDAIHFPLLRVETAAGAGRIWIERGQFLDLDSAYQIARAEGADDLRVLATLSESDRLDFSVVQRNPAASMSDAETRLAAIPPARAGLYRIAVLDALQWVVMER